MRARASRARRRRRDRCCARGDPSAPLGSRGSRAPPCAARTIRLPPARPRERRRAKSRAFREQLFELEALLPGLGAAALDATRAIAAARAESEVASLRSAYQRRRADFAKRRHVHEASLKPSLSNPNRRAELEALEAAEAHRLELAKGAASQLQRALLGAETAQARQFLRRLARTSTTLAVLFDHFVFPPDLIAPEDPPEVRRKALKAKLIDELIETTAADMPAPPPGRKFPLTTWQPLPDGELTPAAAGVPLPIEGEPEAAGTTPAPIEAAGQPLGSFLTPAHRTTFASRDRLYATMRVRYHETARNAASECQALLREEDAWSQNWNKLTSMLKPRSAAK